MCGARYVQCHNHTTNITTSQQMQANATSQQEFQVACILGKRKQANDKYEYRIRWLGYESEDDTWEPMENLTGCRAEINMFNKRKQVRLLKEQK